MKYPDSSEHLPNFPSRDAAFERAVQRIEGILLCAIEHVRFPAVQPLDCSQLVDGCRSVNPSPAAIRHIRRALEEGIDSLTKWSFDQDL